MDKRGAYDPDRPQSQPPDPDTSPESRIAPSPAKRKRTAPLWAAIVAGVGGLAVGVAAGGSGSKSKSTPAAAAATVTVAAPVPEPSTVTTSVFVTVSASAAKPTPPPSMASSAPPTAVTIGGEGTYVVGTDIKAGLYKTAGPADTSIPNCYWERDKNLDGGFDSILANDNVKGPTTVRIASGDAAFKTSGCQEWTKIG